MTPVKRGFHSSRNPMHRRPLTLAELVAPPESKPTLSYLERLAKLKPGSLKESVRRGSMSKPVAAALIAAAPRLGIAGLTADWIHYERGGAPYRGVETPPHEPQAGRSVREESAIPYGDVADADAAYLRFTLQMTRELSAAEREGASPPTLLRLVDLAEKVAVPIHGLRAKQFLEGERQRIRRGETLDGGHGPESA